MYTRTKSHSNQRWSDFTALLLLFLLFALVSTRLQITHWADHMEAVGWLLLMGAAFGFVVGRTRLHTLFSILLIFFYSVFTIPATFIFIVADQPLFKDKFNELITRMTIAGTQLLSNQPVTDSILFIIGMGILFWVIGTAAGFTMARSAQPWIPLMILGGSLLMIEHYQADNRRIFYTWAFAVLSLVLLGRIYYLKLRRNLQTQGIQVGEETSFDFTRGVIVAALILGLAGWIYPGVSRIFFPGTVENTRFTERWEKFTSQFEHLMFSLNQSPPSVEAAAAGDLDLGTGQQLGEKQVLYVEASRPSPWLNQYYWRVRSYDIYQNGKWSDAPMYKRYFRALQSLPYKDYSSQALIEFRFTSYLDQMTMLYAPGQPKKFSKQMDAAITSQGDSKADLVAFYTTPSIKTGGSYTVDAGISMATAEQLSSAGVDYPQWIKDRYLQIPSDISPRIVTLSQQITGGLEDPFSKAAAITNYLRSNIQYQATISAPPPGQDPIDWFLFDYKKGFCNYYASAEVLLLRLAGIPARLSVGYAQGEQSGFEDQFIVREKDSHAWPEVYFPNYGWIPFEPTGAQPSLDYSGVPVGQTSSGQGNATQAAGGNIPGGLRNGEERAMRLLDEMNTDGTARNITPKQPLTVFGKIVFTVSGVLIIALVVFAYLKIRKYRREIKRYIRAQWQKIYQSLTRMPGVGDWFIQLSLTPVERCLWPIERGIRWVNIKLPAGVTAQEMASQFLDIYPEAKADVDFLLRTYQDEIYGNREGSLEECRKADRRLNRIILQAAFRRITAPIRKLNERFGG